MKMNGFFWCVLWWLSVSFCYAKNLRFSHIEIHENGPQGIIKSIAEDSNGFIWVATNQQVFRYDGYGYKQINRIFSFPDAFSDVIEINQFHTTASGEFWIATENKGAFLISGHAVHHYHSQATNLLHKLPSNDIHGITSSANEDVWLTTNRHLIKVYPHQTNKSPEAFSSPNHNNTQIKALSFSDEYGLLLANRSELLSFDLSTKVFKPVNYNPAHEPSYIWDIHEDKNQNLWLSTEAGLFRKEPGHVWQPFLTEHLTETIKSIESHSDTLWLGSAVNGLIRVNLLNDSIDKYKQNKTDSGPLLTNETTRVMLDSQNNLWVTYFDGRVSHANLDTLAFGLNLGIADHSCMTSKAINDINQDNNQRIWMAAQNEVVVFNEDMSSCQTMPLDLSPQPMPYKIHIDGDSVWVASSYGLHHFKNDAFNTVTHFPVNTHVIRFVEKYNHHKLLIVSEEEIFLFQKSDGKLEKVDLGSEWTERWFTFTDVINIDGNFLFSTNQGLYQLVNGKFSIAQEFQKKTQGQEILRISLDSEQNLWAGTYRRGIFKIDQHNNMTSFSESHNIPIDLSIRSIIHTNSQETWVSTDYGLYQYDRSDNQFHQFLMNDGLQSNNFSSGVALVTTDQRLIFGGRFGYNAFDPRQITKKTKPPNVIITELSRFNKNLDVGMHNDGFPLEQDISTTNQLVFTHNDYVMGFEFAALDFADPQRNQYAYQLEGFDPDWNHTDANNRHATYTNLPRGNYTFRVKAANKDGVWNDQGVSLKIKVLPAPWLSWWAITLYVLMVLGLAAWLVNRKLRANQVLARLLQQEVDDKTKELQLQKQKVESLLAKKNELFSNVSHEFRTPLTLILGPMQELIEESQTSRSRQTLTVLKRNANRLLSLVEQLLQLAKTSDFKKAKLSEQETSQQVSAIVESFQHLAQAKKINLKLTSNDEAFIKATDQCLDATLGNLVSNAIKYSPAGGDVLVSSELHQNQLIIRVKDEGAGLTAQQQLDVFKRFKRLDAHQNIEGIGIGLAVAKELAEVNQGTIEVASEPGAGSQFTITLPATENTNHLSDTGHQTGALIEQLTQAEESAPEVNYNNELVNNKNIVLVIEDNHDMRNHIVSVLQSEYHCLQAKNGKEGVANAIKYIPDLIICDVMMPEMDGFKVSRVIRSDQRTSHIPLILLTALNDRENRIKGWREHVDVYMTKPFDREELLVQVDNIITIRNILKKKARIKISKNKTPHHSDLPKKDLEFVEKLIKAIHNHYHDPQLNRDKLASMMAVSDRQLQRKIKALIDQNPMDMLREYRLKKAAEKLKEGYQVGQSSDGAGFKTPTHFSQCFKAQYGLTPKQYQQQFKKNNET